ncbi:MULTISPECIES: hypothetical protein [unclassified Vibrio]|uniref:hypothetical protein n=1 Tax=unclassified Vibrio TaxID=2614977 RepID=UPI0013610F6A|nr:MULTISPECIES: hypothetical protein [unclassified Vibrio]NAW57770.1 hypothetical protein [Vibrio sp. V36_P2S2PM302]NAX28413.1 hypothetical protein [Vibrio sp. V38_P2S17PM301]NAX29583.1 hypothetical protein [Vibrio sp. V37_P2S8PM304]
MNISNKSQALEALATIRNHQANAERSISPLTKAAEAQKASSVAIDIIEYLITSGDAKECK